LKIHDAFHGSGGGPLTLEVRKMRIEFRNTAGLEDLKNMINVGFWKLGVTGIPDTA